MINGHVGGGYILWSGHVLPVEKKKLTASTYNNNNNI